MLQGRRNIFLRVGTALLPTVLGVCSCLAPKTFKSYRSAGDGEDGNAAGKIIDRKSIAISRDADGTTLNVKFKTSVPVQCDLSAWMQASTADGSTAKLVPCKKSELKTEFQEQIASLEKTAAYYVKIHVWSGALSAPKTQEQLVIREPTSSGSIDANGNVHNLFFVRVDVPQKSGEAHKHILEKPILLDDFKKTLVSSVGCGRSLLTSLGVYSQAADGAPFKNLATEGFSFATAHPHPGYPNRFQLDFAMWQWPDRWEWRFEAANGSQNFFSRGAAHFTNLQITAPTKFTFPDGNQTSGLFDAQAQDKNKALNFTWTADGADDISYVNVAIGNANPGKSVYCRYLASANSGSVEASLLGDFSGGNNIYIALENRALQIGDNSGVWVINSFDWRSAKVTF